MDKLVEIMMKLIRSEVCSTPLDVVEPISLSDAESQRLYDLSKSHDLAHIVASALRKNNISVPNEIEARFQKRMFSAVFRYENINYEYNRICGVLERAQIQFVPLKGSVIRKYYAEPWMRTSCDIDVLVRQEDLEKATETIAGELGYEIGLKGRHDVPFDSQTGVHLELHYSLIEDSELSVGEDILLDVWNYVVPTEGSKYRLELRDDMFYYYHIAHIAKHFVQGGCGVRPFVDMCVMDASAVGDSEQRNALLKKGKLDVFAKRVEELCGVWFGDKPHTNLTAQMQNYILGAGVYGTIDNKIAVEQGKKGGKLGYAISRIWLPYDVLRFHYPSLEGRKLLLPFYEIRRWGKLIFFGGLKRSVDELGVNKNMSSDKVSYTADLLGKLGL